MHHAVADVLSGDADRSRTVRRLAMAKALTWEDPVQAAKCQDVDFALMEREISETRAMCESTHSPVVYSHNDLLPGNIMGLHPPGEPAIAPAMHLQFIDFEYGCYGFRGFDWGATCLLPSGSSSDCASPDACIRKCCAHQELYQVSEARTFLGTYTPPFFGVRAFGVECAMQFASRVLHKITDAVACAGNHFNEWAGLDCDYGRYPSLEQQELFLREYLQTSAVRSVSPEQVWCHSQRCSLCLCNCEELQVVL